MNVLLDGFKEVHTFQTNASPIAVASLLENPSVLNARGLTALRNGKNKSFSRPSAKGGQAFLRSVLANASPTAGRDGLS